MSALSTDLSYIKDLRWVAGLQKKKLFLLKIVYFTNRTLNLVQFEDF